MEFKRIIADKIYSSLNGKYLNKREILKLIEQPKDIKNGDFSFPTFILARKLRQNPKEIASNIISNINFGPFSKILTAGPYVNFFVPRNKFLNQLLHKVLEDPTFGENKSGKQGKIAIDMSSPNIAKPMSMGHLRSTVIGEALSRIARANGYVPYKINFLGDWGTQFGLMIAAYKLWGNEQKIKKDPINELVSLYVKINKKAENNSSLKEKGRKWFKKLEIGDSEARKLWSWFKDISLSEFQKVYSRLGVTFNSMNGEAFYNDRMSDVIKLLKDKKLLIKSQGAEIVNLEKLLPNKHIPLAMIVRSDGATQYITRDLAAAIYRYEKLHFVSALYVVGNEQKDHFRQIRAILKLAGKNWSDRIEHIGFGLITVNGKKMSTRKGNVVQLVSVLNKADELAKEQIKKKNPHLKNSDKVAREVGTGAVIFNDLQNQRELPINFDLEKIVQFEGNTGPYVQYTHVRANSILRKSHIKLNKNQSYKLYDPEAWSIVTKLSQYPQVVVEAWQSREPGVIAKYLLRLSREFNTFYGHTKVLVENEAESSRLALVKAVGKILQKGLKLLDVHAPLRM